MTSGTSEAFLAGILGQPDEIVRTARALIGQRAALGRIRRGAARIPVFTGMGAAFAATYPAVTHLASLGVPVLRASASELLSFRLESLGRRQTIVIASRSGEGPDVAALARELRNGDRSAFVVAITCSERSPLTSLADVTVLSDPGYSGPGETTGFAASLFASSAVGRAMAGEDIDAILDSIEISAKRTAARIRDAVATPGVSAQSMSAWADRPRLVLLGDGCARATGEFGAQLLAGSAGVATEYHDSAEFRRSMLEGVSDNMVAVVMATEAQTKRANLELAEMLIERGAKVLVMTPVSTMSMPYGADIFISGRLNRLIAPAALVVPLQLLAWQRLRELREHRGIRA